MRAKASAIFLKKNFPPPGCLVWQRVCLCSIRLLRRHSQEPAGIWLGLGGRIVLRHDRQRWPPPSPNPRRSESSNAPSVRLIFFLERFRAAIFPQHWALKKVDQKYEMSLKSGDHCRFGFHGDVQGVIMCLYTLYGVFMTQRWI